MTRNRLRLAAGGLAVLLCAVPRASAQTAPPLGAARGFAVLANSTVTNTGASVVTGDLGVSPGTSVTGFPPGVVVAGTIHTNDAAAMAAQTDLIATDANLTSQPCTVNLTGQDLGGMALTPAVYCFNSAAQLTGTLTLDAQGNPDAVFIFKIGSSLTTANGSSVAIINSGSACNVFWQMGSSATLGTGSSFVGTLVATASITANTGASVTGRTLARGGAVTLDTNQVTVTCPSITPPGCGPLAMSPATLPDGRVAVAYNQTLVASGGTAPYTFTVTSGALPAGLTLTAGGVVAGTPIAAGSSTVMIRATDANGCFVERSFTILVAAAPICPPITLSPATLPDGRVAVAYSQTLVASGGLAPYTFSVTSGALPAGLTLTTAGLIAGTPTTAGTSTVTIRATDANGCFVERSYTIVVAAAPPLPPICPPITLSPATLPDGQVGAAYSQTLTAAGGTPPYVFGVTAGALPAGITLTAAGLLAGTPTTTGAFSFTVRATDSLGCFVERSLTMSIPIPVPALPYAFVIVLALGLFAIGYLRQRRSRQAQ